VAGIGGKKPASVRQHITGARHTNAWRGSDPHAHAYTCVDTHSHACVDTHSHACDAHSYAGSQSVTVPITISVSITISIAIAQSITVPVGDSSYDI
jgi:hypothetical protein